MDQKASITLAIVIAVGGFAITQVFGDKGSLHAVHGDQLWPIRIMGIAFLAAGLASLFAVFPTLKRSKAKVPGPGLIFFGHLRHLSADDIDKRLAELNDDEIRRQLASQLEQTSRVAWQKHVRLQIAHGLLVFAVLAFLVAEVW